MTTVVVGIPMDKMDAVIYLAKKAGGLIDNVYANGAYIGLEEACQIHNTLFPDNPTCIATVRFINDQPTTVLQNMRHPECVYQLSQMPLWVEQENIISNLQKYVQSKNKTISLTQLDVYDVSKGVSLFGLMIEPKRMINLANIYEYRRYVGQTLRFYGITDYVDVYMY
jgi:hypothetical protein